MWLSYIPNFTFLGRLIFPFGHDNTNKYAKNVENYTRIKKKDDNRSITIISQPCKTVLNGLDWF